MSKNRDMVVLCVDRNMIVPAAFVADAVIAHAGARARHLEVVIVTDAGAVTEQEGGWLAGRGIGHRIADFAALRRFFDRSGRLTTATLVKLALPDIFAEHEGRILYLDADVTIHADVSVLFTLDLKDLPIAACRRGVVFHSDEQRRIAEAHFGELGMTRPYTYFNSGVMLIDAVRWKQEDLTARALDFIAGNRDICLLPDEDSLNAVLDGRFAALSPIWNMVPRRPPAMLVHGRHRPAIIHYSGHDKPWKRFGSAKPLFPDMQGYKLYAAFLARSPWPRWLAGQWQPRDLLDGAMSTLAEAVRRPGSRPYSPAEYAERFDAFAADAVFADVEQGITERVNGVLAPRARGEG